MRSVHAPWPAKGKVTRLAPGARESLGEVSQFDSVGRTQRVVQGRLVLHTCTFDVGSFNIEPKTERDPILDPQKKTRLNSRIILPQVGASTDPAKPQAQVTCAPHQAVHAYKAHTHAQQKISYLYPCYQM